MNILIVDDDVDCGEALAEFLEAVGHKTFYLPDPMQAISLLERQSFSLVVTDLRMPGIDGLELMRRIRARPIGNDIAIIVLTGHADTDSAITALRHGAYDYLCKPVNTDELELTIERCAQDLDLRATNRALTHQFDWTVKQATDALRSDLTRTQKMLSQEFGLAPLATVSAQMRELHQRAHLYHMHADVAVLIEGETGVGKEVLARLIHYGDTYPEQPFVALNCAAVPAALFESELFGYAAGAFTGGLAQGAKGKLELAGNGTLFLDEIGEIPVELQSKLLRIIQERSFYRVGGLRRLECRARLICASNRQIESLVQSGKFRADLFYRLQVGHMLIPPLRERRSDIMPLATHFLHSASERRRRQFRAFSSDAVDLLKTHDWFGNVRELENAIERAVLEYDAEIMEASHLAFITSALMPPATQLSDLASKPVNNLELMPETLPDDFGGLPLWEKHIVRSAVQKFNGNVSHAARYLKISRSALQRRVKKYNM